MKITLQRPEQDLRRSIRFSRGCLRGRFVFRANHPTRTVLDKWTFSGLTKTFCGCRATRVIRMPRLTQFTDPFRQSESKKKKRSKLSVSTYVFVRGCSYASRRADPRMARALFFHLGRLLLPSRSKHRCSETTEAAWKHAYLCIRQTIIVSRCLKINIHNVWCW